jgi:hypothetical protein
MRRYRYQGNLLPEDGVIDPVAIRIAIAGDRVVRMTLTERQIAARTIIASGAGVAELSGKLGIGSHEISAFLAGIGYRLSPRTGRDRHRTIVRPE